MKRLLLTLAVIWTVSQLTFAQDVSSLIKNFKDERGAEYVSIPSFVMSIGKLFMDDEEVEERIAKKVNALQVLDLEDCSKDVKERFAQAYRQLNTEGYETLMQVNEDGEKVHILAKGEKDIIHELVFLCVDDDCTLINMKCKIRKEDIARLVNEQTGKRKKQ